MLNPFVCCTFNQEEEDDPRFKAKRNSFSRSHSKIRINPYSTRGLDQFSALLADLDKKRQQIYSQTRPRDISFVRFASSNTNDFVPIVVKVKNRDHKHNQVRRVTSNSEAMDESDKKADSWNIKCRPSFYLPAIVSLILVFLAVFGRSVATLCICVLCYVIPTLKDGSKSRDSMKKKDYVRGLSEKKMVYSSPTSSNAGA